VPPRATEQGRGIDPALEMVILKCLEKDPNQRFSSILELRDALLGMLGGMETHPPGFASVNVSGMRPLPAHLTGIAPGVAAVAPTIIPQALPQMLPTMAGLSVPQHQMVPQQPMIPSHPTPASQSHLSGPNPYYSNLGYSQMMLPTPPPQQATPWWVWFVGGALAVGLGVAAAVWYASRGDDKPVESVAKTSTSTLQATPIENTALPQLVELRFDSLPSGGVYAEGQSAELCTTPCATKLDMRDGGSTERRAYVVKSPGHKDGRIDVDLTKPEREFKITLDREATVTEVKVVDPVIPEKQVEPDKAPAKSKGRNTKTAKKDPKPEEKDVKPLPTFRPEDKPEGVDGTKRDPGKKPGKIDATETIDPFQKK
jgi:hypothetical protein